MSKNRLGKGLGALLAENNDDNDSPDKVSSIFVENIEPNPFQPRQEFEQKSLEELSHSIKENGIIQPITVRQVKPNKYQIVTGERRWRASMLIGIKEIPALIKDYTDMQMMEIALIENLQREDLNPIEEAQAYQRMMEEFNMTQEEVAKRVGKSRSSIANAVRLLKLAPKIQVYVSRGTFSMGHARALLSLKDTDMQINAADYVINNELSVRETESYINKLKMKTEEDEENDKEKSDKKEDTLTTKWLEARDRLSSYLGIDVKISNNKNNKVISIECKNYEDVQKILSRLKRG